MSSCKMVRWMITSCTLEPWTGGCGTASVPGDYRLIQLLGAKHGGKRDEVSSLGLTRLGIDPFMGSAICDSRSVQVNVHFRSTLTLVVAYQIMRQLQIRGIE